MFIGCACGQRTVWLRYLVRVERTMTISSGVQHFNLVLALWQCDGAQVCEVTMEGSCGQAFSEGNRGNQLGKIYLK